MNSTVIFVLSVPAILAIVNLLKGVGLSGKWSAMVAVFVAVALNVANFYLASVGAYQAAMQGAILGLSAAGLYDATGAKAVTNNVTVTPSIQPVISEQRIADKAAARTSRTAI